MKLSSSKSSEIVPGHMEGRDAVTFEIDDVTRAAVAAQVRDSRRKTFVISLIVGAALVSVSLYSASLYQARQRLIALQMANNALKAASASEFRLEELRRANEELKLELAVRTTDDIKAVSPSDYQVISRDGFLVSKIDQTKQKLTDGHIALAQFNPNGTLVAIVPDNNKDVQIFSTSDAKLVNTLILNDTPTGIQFSPDGTNFFVTTSAMATKFNTISGDKLLTINNARFAAYSPDGTKFVTADENGVITVWDAATASPIGLPVVAYVPGTTPTSLGFARGQTQMAATYPDGTLVVWDIGTGKPVEWFHLSGTGLEQRMLPTSGTTPEKSGPNP